MSCVHLVNAIKITGAKNRNMERASHHITSVPSPLQACFSPVVFVWSVPHTHSTTTTAFACIFQCFFCQQVQQSCNSSSASPDTSEEPCPTDMVKMTKSKTFQAYLPSCHRTYSCIHCRAHLANHDELISKVRQLSFSSHLIQFTLFYIESHSAAFTWLQLVCRYLYTWKKTSGDLQLSLRSLYSHIWSHHNGPQEKNNTREMYVKYTYHLWVLALSVEP